jgi:AbrB family looped-hinge helix DNA binding protein
VGTNFQITFPAKVRKQMGIDCGDYLLVKIRDGHIMLIPENTDPVAALKDRHRKIWDGTDAQEFVNQERDAWEDHS